MMIKRHFSAWLVWPQLLEKFLVFASLLRSDTASVYWRGQNCSQGICPSASTVKGFFMTLVFSGALLRKDREYQIPCILPAHGPWCGSAAQVHLSEQPVLASPVAMTGRAGRKVCIEDDGSLFGNYLQWGCWCVKHSIVYFQFYF